MACPGYCCRCFILPYGPEELDQALSQKEDVVLIRLYSYYLNGPRDVAFDKKELEQLKDILIPLGKDPSKFDEKNLPELKDKGNREKGVLDTLQYYYTCKEYDWDTHLCRIYETRPVMCRRYPNNRPCEYEGCYNVSESIP